jgi:hypothetical protein
MLLRKETQGAVEVIDLLASETACPASFCTPSRPCSRALFLIWKGYVTLPPVLHFETSSGMEKHFLHPVTTRVGSGSRTN